MVTRLSVFGALPLILAAACSDGSESSDSTGAGGNGNASSGNPASGTLGDPASGGTSGSPATGTPPAGTTTPPESTPPGPPATQGPPAGQAGTTVKVKLVPEQASASPVRVNFGLPLGKGASSDPVPLRVRAAGADVPATARTLAKHGDGSVRSVQVQFDLAVPAATEIEVTFGAAGPAGSAIVPVDTTLVASGDAPKVWALLPPTYLAQSGIVGPIVPFANVAAGPMKSWQTLCNYTSSKYSTTAFLASSSTTGNWLYDRGTVFYRGYAATGSQDTLRAAYKETALYRSRETGTGTAFRIGVPGASTDLKYHYAQNLAIHYLLTGDDRFRETAENVATRAASLWSPSYDGSETDFWTERNAGFLLLAQHWAAMVSDDKAAAFRAAADATVDATLAVQDTYPVGYTDQNARCFAHHGNAHDASEGNPYFGCSPWMSAILADALDAYSRETTAARATKVSASLVKLGKMFARDAADPSTLRPYYWMGVGTTQDAPDDYDEHRGETAYVIAMAWHHTGRTDAALKTSADAFVNAFSSQGEVGQLRSFNWQCRSAVATPAFLMP